MDREQFQRITCLSNGLQNPVLVLKIRVSTVQFRPSAPIESITYNQRIPGFLMSVLAHYRRRL
jgi:hypothetical protein